MESSICVAVMTCLPASYALLMIIFWITGMSSTGSSTPISPLATMYAKATVFDLVLPRVAAGLPVSEKEIARMWHGGLCLGCPVCHYPDCGFGKSGD